MGRKNRVHEESDDIFEDGLEAGPWTVWLERGREGIKTRPERIPLCSDSEYDQIQGYVETANKQEISVLINGPTDVDIEVEVIWDGMPLCCYQYAAGNRCPTFEINGAFDDQGVRRAFTLEDIVPDANAQPTRVVYYGEVQVLIQVGKLGSRVASRNQQQKIYAPHPKRAPGRIKAKQKHCLQLGKELPTEDVLDQENLFTFRHGYHVYFRYNSRDLLVAESNGSVPSRLEEENQELKWKISRMKAEDRRKRRREGTASEPTRPSGESSRRRR